MSNAKIPKGSNYKVGEYNLVKGPFPYHAREDNTTLPGNTLIPPSMNVVNNFANRLQHVRGYELDGDASTVIDSGIVANYDFYPVKSGESVVRNMRCGSQTVAGNDGKLQFRYVDPTTKIVSWINLTTGLSKINLSFDGNFFDLTEGLKLLLWVDGSNNVFEWNGAVTTIASNTATTLTKQGTTSWKDDGFYITRSPRSININGIDYTYTGGETTATLTGLTALPTFNVGGECHQSVVTTALSAMTSIVATFGPTVIGSGRLNQVYLGASNSNILYISKRDNYKDYSFTSPTRLIGEGSQIVMDAPPVKFIAQEVHGMETAYDLWISTGQDRWSIVRSIVSSDNTAEILDFIRLKSASLQGSLSERLCAKMKNHIIFVSYDKVLNGMGYISYQFVPVMQDLSYPIINDMSSYDFTDGSVFYHKNYIYIALPKHGIIRVYNMTNQTDEQYSNYNPQEQLDSQQPFFWEAPITYPISGFYVVDGDLYGHGYNTSESYKLFTGGSLNGQDITTNATFAYTDMGDRTQSKGSNEVWVEGYIKQNTKLSVSINEDLDYFSSVQTRIIDGSDKSIVAYGGGGHSLGQDSLGSRPLGGTLLNTSIVPAWFHTSKTYIQNTYYLESISFDTKGIDLDYQLLTFGTNSTFTTEGNNSITD
jgi:hypothetical protein